MGHLAPDYWYRGPMPPARMVAMADDRRWFDGSQPQTLQGAVMPRT